MAPLDELELYSSLPSLYQAIARQAKARQAKAREQTLSFNEVLSGPVRDVFLKHSAEHLFCAYLQHCHHSLSPGQVVVKVEGKGHVMSRQDVRRLVFVDNKVVPSTWMTVDGKILPMEYSILPNSADVPMPSEAFLEDLTTVLLENHCMGLLSLDTRRMHGWAELYTGSTVSVVRSMDEKDNNDIFDRHKFVDVAFAFDPDLPGFRVHGRCAIERKPILRDTITLEGLEPPIVHRYMSRSARASSG